MPNLFKSVLSLTTVLAIGLSLSGMITLTGCEQDPLDGYDRSIIDGVPPKNTKTNPMQSDAVIIDVGSLYDVQEGETLSFKVSGRVLLPQSTGTLEIRNIASFPGMVYDEATEMVSWLVPYGYTNGKNYEVSNLNIMMVTNEEPYLYDEKSVQISVFKKSALPVIVKLDNLPTEMAEGDAVRLVLTAQIPGEMGQPELVIVPSHWNKNANGFMKQYGAPVQDFRDKSLWRFQIDLRPSGEITKNWDTFYFGLKVISSAGAISLMSDYNFHLYTELQEPEFSWDRKMSPIFTAGEANSFSFSVYDPSFEGQVQIDSNEICKNLLGADCSCKPMANMIQCTINWTPDVATEGDFVVEAQAYNELSPNGKTLNKSAELYRNIKVKKGSTP